VNKAGSGATNGERHGGALGSEDSQGDGGGTASCAKEAANAQPMEIDAPVGTPLTPHQIVSRSQVDICTLRGYASSTQRLIACSAAAG
jgi:hypothetical protein